jgi:hypothetical protein
MEAVPATAGRNQDMSNKRIRLPKEGLVEPDRRKPQNPAGIDAGEDVEGHGFVNPAPPASFSKRSPSSGGESLRNNEDGKADPAD